MARSKALAPKKTTERDLCRLVDKATNGDKAAQLSLVAAMRSTDWSTFKRFRLKLADVLVERQAQREREEALSRKLLR